MPVLYGVGVGPGDPELLTIKAIRVIESVLVVAGPVARLDDESCALNIITDILKPDQIVIKLHFPMIRDLSERIKKRRAAALLLVEYLADGKDVAFITEGDPLLHSTFGYILEHLPEDIQVEVIPGVSSIMAASADAKMPLVQANETLAVIPMTRDNITELEQVLQNFDTIVLMKVYRVLDQIIALLDKLDLLEKAILVERASHVESRVITNFRALNGRQVHYFSLLIIHAGGNSKDS
jgi:precorrin-2/cobalt-factor-2 C20-methyltransferase